VPLCEPARCTIVRIELELSLAASTEPDARAQRQSAKTRALARCVGTRVPFYRYLWPDRALQRRSRRSVAGAARARRPESRRAHTVIRGIAVSHNLTKAVYFIFSCFFPTLHVQREIYSSCAQTDESHTSNAHTRDYRNTNTTRDTPSMPSAKEQRARCVLVAAISTRRDAHARTSAPTGSPRIPHSSNSRARSQLPTVRPAHEIENVSKRTACVTALQLHFSCR